MNKEADLEKPKTIIIHSDYLYLQDLGSASYTEFEHDDVIEHIMDNDELMDYRVGLIHSHHTMKAFFSGTDTEELHEKAENGLYLSLIVNNHMEPVAKIAWVGETERKIVSASSWSFGGFNRKPKPKTRVEVSKVYYEIDLEIEFHKNISDISERYAKLEKEEKSFKNSAREAHKGTQSNLWAGSDNSFPSHGLKDGYESAWDRRIRLEAEESAKSDSKDQSDRLGAFDLTNRGGQSTTQTNGNDEADLVTQLERFNKLDSAFAAILTQSPRTKLGFAGALAEAMTEVKNLVESLLDVESEQIVHKEVIDDSSFMVMYSEEAANYAAELLQNGDDMVAEMLGEFYIEDEDYHAILQKMYDKLSKEANKTILGEHLKEGIVQLTITDEVIIDGIEL